MIFMMLFLVTWLWNLVQFAGMHNGITGSNWKPQTNSNFYIPSFMALFSLSISLSLRLSSRLAELMLTSLCNNWHTKCVCDTFSLCNWLSSLLKRQESVFYIDWYQCRKTIFLHTDRHELDCWVSKVWFLIMCVPKTLLTAGLPRSWAVLQKKTTHRCSQNTDYTIDKSSVYLKNSL